MRAGRLERDRRVASPALPLKRGRLERIDRMGDSTSKNGHVQILLVLNATTGSTETTAARPLSKRCCLRIYYIPTLTERKCDRPIQRSASHNTQNGVSKVETGQTSRTTRWRKEKETRAVVFLREISKKQTDDYVLACNRQLQKPVCPLRKIPR